MKSIKLKQDMEKYPDELKDYTKMLNKIILEYPTEAIDFEEVKEVLKSFSKKLSPKVNPKKCICKTKVESKCYWHGK